MIQCDSSSSGHSGFDAAPDRYAAPDHAPGSVVSEQPAARGVALDGACEPVDIWTDGEFRRALSADPLVASQELS